MYSTYFVQNATLLGNDKLQVPCFHKQLQEIRFVDF